MESITSAQLAGSEQQALSRRRFLHAVATLGTGLILAMLQRAEQTLAAGSLLWGPYLQNSTTSSITVMWAMRVSGVSEVRYRVGTAAETSVAATATYILRPGAVEPYGQYDSFYLQSATLTGLVPGQIYSYRVITDGVELGASTLRVARPANESSFSFVVLGDSGSGNTHQMQVATRMRQLVPEFMLHCGDMIGYSPTRPTVYEEWYAKLFAIYAGYERLLDSIPFYPAVGNHDYQDYPLAAPVSDLAPYLQIFSLPRNATVTADREKYYSFDYGNAHIVSLNSYLPLQSGGSDSAMVSWLKNDLANTSQFWKIVLLQAGPFSSNAWAGGIPGGSEGSLNRNARQILVPIFQQYQIDLVLSGDQHIYERSMPWAKTSDPNDIGRPTAIDQGGIVYVITGGGGGPIGSVQTGADRGPWSVAPAGAMVRAYHATRVVINGARLTIEAHEEVNGTLSNPFDSFTIDRAAALADTLTGGTVTPEVGAVGATYTFQVTYTNASNQPPTQANLLLDALPLIPMSLVSGTFAGGALYRYATALAFGTHQFAFDFGAGLRLPAQGTLAKPVVNDPPNLPAPLNPANAANAVQPLGLALSWSGGDPNSAAGDSVTYDLYLNAGTLPNSPTYAGLTSTSFTVPAGAVAYGTSYIWKVVARDSYGDTRGPTSNWSFATMADPHPQPSAPSSPSPANNATGTLRTLQLSWAASTAGSDPVTYDVEVQGNIVANSLTTPQYDLTDLAYGTTYSWQVSANSFGGTTTGPLWHFTSQPNPPPQLSAGSVSPTTGTTDDLFTFEVTYADPLARPAAELMVLIDSIPEAMELISGTPASGAIYRYTTPLLSETHTYTFTATNVEGSSARLPATGSYSVVVHARPTLPNTPTPADGAIDVAKNVELRWAASTADGDPVTYDLLINDQLVASDLTSLRYSPPNLAYGTIYDWQIIARSVAGPTAGPRWRFTTLPDLPPQLSAGSVSPSTGTLADTFTFEVTYSDPYARAATQAAVVIDGVATTMAKVSGSTSSGAIYRFATQLSGGTHAYLFDFANSDGWTVQLPETGANQLIVHVPPSSPPNPVPTDNSSGFARGESLRWDAALANDDPVTYDLLLQGERVASGLTSPRYVPSGLAYATTYSWQVIARSFGGTTSGAVWHFTTLPSIPQLGSGGVAALNGNMLEGCLFEVTYTDPAGLAATQATVVVDGQPHTMSAVSGDPAAGVLYRSEAHLTVGAHSYLFRFTSHAGSSVQLYDSEPQIVVIGYSIALPLVGK